MKMLIRLKEIKKNTKRQKIEKLASKNFVK